MILENGLIDTLLKADLVAANKHLFVGEEGERYAVIFKGGMNYV